MYFALKHLYCTGFLRFLKWHVPESCVQVYVVFSSDFMFNLMKNRTNQAIRNLSELKFKIDEDSNLSQENYTIKKYRIL